MSLAILIPGQGSQFVGMSEDVFEARPGLLIDQADSILGWSMRELCSNGPEFQLIDTRYAQPVLYAVVYAMWLEVRDQLPMPAFLAGHSLGEYTALAAAGMMSFEDGLRVVAARGEAMAEAASQTPSGMAALLGADEATARAIVEACNAEGGRVTLANLNSPAELVVAGSLDDMEWMMTRAKDLGARRVMPLQVAGAFHTHFMDDAVAPVRSALDSVTFSEPAIPVVGNTEAVPHTVGGVADTLARQVTEPVRFADSLRYMAEAGVTTFIHLGPGHVTAGMAKRTVPDARVESISHLADLPHVLDDLAHLR